MKVGDLVELSAYGKQISINKRWIGKVGLLSKFDSSNKSSYTVTWYGGIVLKGVHIRRDLKKYIDKK